MIRMGRKNSCIKKLQQNINNCLMQKKMDFFWKKSSIDGFCKSGLNII